MYTQHAPPPVQASFVSPTKFASNMNQLSNGATPKIIRIIILTLKAALKLLVLIFLLSSSRNFIPEYSILIK